MPDISIVGVRLTVEGSEQSIAKMAAFDAAAKSTTASLREVGGDQVAGGLSRLVISVENVGAGMDRTAGRASAFHGILRDLDGTLSSVSGKMMTFTAYGLGGAAVGFAGLATAAAAFGVRAASSFQQTQISFETMLGSVAKGDALFANLKAFNLQTPFGLPDLTSSAQTLLQYGFTGDNVMPVLQTLANVSATAPGGMGAQDLQRQALALGQISSSGVVRGQDINQLTQAGFPIMKLLQQITGQSGQQLQHQLQGGGLTLPASSLIDAIANGGGSVLSPYADAARKQSLTGAGQWSNFTDTLRSDMATASLPLLRDLTTMLPQLTTSLDKVMAVALPPLNEFFAMAAKNLPGFVDRSIPAIQGFFDGLQKNGPEIGKFFGDLASLLPDLVRIGGDLVPVVDGLARGFDFLLHLPFGTEAVAGLLVTLTGYKMLSGTVTVITDLARAFKALAVGEEAASAASLLPHGGSPGAPATAGAGSFWKTVGGGVAVVGGTIGSAVAMTDIINKGPSWGNVAGTVGSSTAAGVGLGLLGGPFAEVTVPVGAAGGFLAGVTEAGIGSAVHAVTQHHHHVTIVTHDTKSMHEVMDQYYRDSNRRAGSPGSQ